MGSRTGVEVEVFDEGDGDCGGLPWLGREMVEGIGLSVVTGLDIDGVGAGSPCPGSDIVEDKGLFAVNGSDVDCGFV